MARSSSGKSMHGRPMKMHSRNRQNSQSQSSSGGREMGHLSEPMQAEMASGNEGLAESSSQEQNRNRGMRRMKRAA